jgi:type VI secretion system protein ImpK
MPPEVQSRRSQDIRDDREGLESTRNLALLYEGLLTVIVRMQGQRQQASVADTFRGRVKSALTEVERDAASAGYSAQDVRDTHFAVVAFLDSVVLHSSDPIRPEWEKKTLQEELFGQTDAGVVFFEKLDNFRSREDSQQLADVLEVYLLCLLLGFEGRYSGGLRGELDSIAEKVRRRISDIRGESGQISPSATLPSLPTPQAARFVSRVNRYRVLSLAVPAVTVLLFLLWKLNLLWLSNQLRSKIF